MRRRAERDHQAGRRLGETSGKNGSIQDVLVLAPPAPGAGFCPPGQTATLVSVSYSDVTLDEAHAGPHVLEGPYARTFYVI